MHLVSYDNFQSIVVVFFKLAKWASYSNNYDIRSNTVRLFYMRLWYIELNIEIKANA